MLYIILCTSVIMPLSLSLCLSISPEWYKFFIYFHFLCIIIFIPRKCAFLKYLNIYIYIYIKYLWGLKYAMISGTRWKNFLLLSFYCTLFSHFFISLFLYLAWFSVLRNIKFMILNIANIRFVYHLNNRAWLLFQSCSSSKLDNFQEIVTKGWTKKNHDKVRCFNWIACLK